MLRAGGARDHATLLHISVPAGMGSMGLKGLGAPKYPGMHYVRCIDCERPWQPDSTPIVIDAAQLSSIWVGLLKR